MFYIKIFRLQFREDLSENLIDDEEISRKKDVKIKNQDKKGKSCLFPNKYSINK